MCILCAWVERMNKLISGRSWENNLNLSREQTLERRCYPVVLSVVMQRSVKTEWRAWKSTEEKSLSGENWKVRTTNTVLTNAFESLFDSGLFETQRQKRITHVIKTVRHTSDLHQSQIPKKSKTWNCDFSANRISRCENPSKINRQRCNSFRYCCCFILTSG